MLPLAIAKKGAKNLKSVFLLEYLRACLVGPQLPPSGKSCPTKQALKVNKPE